MWYGGINLLFNLNEFLMAVSFALDFVEMDVLGVTSNHGKRTAYISLQIASELGLSAEELHDIAALAILHDNGISEKTLHDKFLDDESTTISAKSIERIKEHCTIGEDNIESYPFLTNPKDVIKYHHEKFDGTGFFGLKGGETPLMSQIIHIADVLEMNFDFEKSNLYVRKKAIEFACEQKNKMFSAIIVDAFCNVASREQFWSGLKDDLIKHELKKSTPEYSMELSFKEIRNITWVFSKIIDAKSKYTQRHSKDLSEKVASMAEYYNLEEEEKMKLIIAADLHDIGKLAVPNDILDSPSKLTNEEFQVIKKHPYYTRVALQEIRGFEDITEWASNHHEKLNGQGYPIGKNKDELDFNSRLIACLDIYEALIEDRPYRDGLNHEAAITILKNMKDACFIDSKIVEDINHFFGNLNATNER
jgi:HD-GYP domain-containing protein (c-di-GMP phosphodiesterase class II)